MDGGWLMGACEVSLVVLSWSKTSTSPPSVADMRQSFDGSWWYGTIPYTYIWQLIRRFDLL